MILNTSNAPPGKHWVGLFRSSGEQVLYDSFGRKQGEGDLNTTAVAAGARFLLLLIAFQGRPTGIL
jgi:hypothetical protein